MHIRQIGIEGESDPSDDLMMSSKLVKAAPAVIAAGAPGGPVGVGIAVGAVLVGFGIAWAFGTASEVTVNGPGFQAKAKK